MSDEPGGTTHAEHAELDALRRRAYGPDADIMDDPDAVQRLSEIEDQLVRARAARAAIRSSATRKTGALGAASPTPALAQAGTDLSPSSPDAASAATAPVRAYRWRIPVLVGAAAVVAVIGALVWSEGRTTGSPADEAAISPAATPDARAISDEAEYERYLDGLRDELLSGPGMQEIEARLIREQLRPYGTLYGRTVGAGPTVDQEFCMIVANLPEPSITCISIEDAYASPVSVILPAWYSDSESDEFTGLGELVSFTLMPGGSVVAEPADVVDAADPATPAPDS